MIVINLLQLKNRPLQPTTEMGRLWVGSAVSPVQDPFPLFLINKESAPRTLCSPHSLSLAWWDCAQPLLQGWAWDPGLAE